MSKDTLETLRAEVEEYRRASAPDISQISGKRIAAYVRVSSKAIGNDEARQVYGVEQFSKIYKVEPLTYTEWSSAKGGRTRAVFQNMLKDAKANKFDILWAEQPSRLGRTILEGLLSIRELHECGVKVFIEKFNKLYDPSNSMDKQLLYNQFIVAEIENDWNSQNTKKSMKVKSIHLKKWADMEGLININHGGGKTFNKMIIPDPLYKGDENKKGICQVEIPHMDELFVMYHMLGYTAKGLADVFTLPVNPKCQYGCWNGKKMPFNSMPRKHKAMDGSKRLYRSDVGKFLTEGGWNNYIKSDSEIKKAFKPSKRVPHGPFETKSKIRAKRTCGCGQQMSSPTVSTHVKRLCYDTGAEMKRSPDAFVRATAESTELSLDDLSKLITSGKPTKVK